jgi:hypothetical protein
LSSSDRGGSNAGEQTFGRLASGSYSTEQQGPGQALVLANPPMSAWGRSPEGWIDVYDLRTWDDTNLDALIQRAVATPTNSMVNTGTTLALHQIGMLLLFAGDRPGDAVYGESRIPIAPGSYEILEGRFDLDGIEEVRIYRYAR